MLTESFVPSIGSTAGSLIVYALFSAYISGEIILEREVEKSGWQEKCLKFVQSEIKQSQPAPQAVPRFKFDSLFDGNDDGSKALRRLFSPLDGIIDQQYQQLDRAKKLNEERLRLKLQQAGFRCNCAATFLSENRVSLGLYAASGRVFMPPLFKNLNAELITALNSPHCSGGSKS